MAALYLIRHGQASFGKADYDQLSDKGVRQAQLLGEHWQALTAPDKCYSGHLLRHGQSADAFLSAYFLSADKEKNLPLLKHPGFNEFDHLDVLARYNPKWRDYRHMQADIAGQENPRAFFRQEFTHAMQRWISGAYDNYQQSWLQFKQGCLDALQEVISQERRSLLQENRQTDNRQATQNILIFTSGGPISVIIGHVLGLGDQQALTISQQLTNTGVTKLLLSRQGLHIDYVNNYRHLEIAGREWITQV
ncbi:histidine phosphatase family protein [Thalassomonas viridans]|uniref:Histidine phosphatase family protein n=1 Tax=Thalassomonas viridans TaxID=137584 RepID=A0AAE9Z7N0_9GAMM|nr:histidine phosphatase family protein [Thalassomonas viridans]WDE07550.1 histidine phosphatase family protein [Thalassomonas viridans]